MPSRSSHLDVPRLIAASRRADDKALNRLLGVYRNYLLLLAQNWMNAAYKGKADPSDIVQETLWEAHQAFGQFGGANEEELTAWLRKILVRNVMDVARRYKTAGRDVRREEAWDPGRVVHRIHRIGRVAIQGSPSASAQRRELGVVLANSLAELQDDHRQVIILRNLNGLSWTEVAKKMGRSDEAARKLWTRALAELKPLIEDRL